MVITLTRRSSQGSPNQDKTSEPQCIVVNRTSILGQTIASGKKAQDSKEGRVMTWLDQDQPFHGLKSVENNAGSAAVRNVEGSPPSSMEVENGSNKTIGE